MVAPRDYCHDDKEASGISGCPWSGKKSGKFQSDQKSWKRQGILKWVREFCKFMESQGTLYMALRALKV